MSQSAQFRGNCGCPLNPQGDISGRSSLADVALPSALCASTAEGVSSAVARNSERVQARASAPLAQSIYLYSAALT